jgi:heme o synthase
MTQTSTLSCPSLPPWRAYLKLCKCRVVALMLLTAWVGMCLASPSWVPMQPFVMGTIGIALGAAAGAAVNHVLDQQIDAVMRRTQHRPLVQGQLKTWQALCFAGCLGVASMVVLDVWVNRLTAVLTFCSLVGYAFVYTGWLKRATPQNIVIGGLAGATPPLLGWTAVTGQVDPAALALVMIVFVWTPPHFWALAIYRYKDYEAAKIPMLPVTHGIPFTKLYILLYTVLLLAVSMLPYIMNMSGVVYLVVANVLGVGFCALALLLKLSDSRWLAWQTFRYSILYLTVLFVALLVDHYGPWA